MRGIRLVSFQWHLKMSIYEIKKIYEYLNISSNVTEEKLAKRINEIFLISFGSDVYIEDIEGCLKVAKNIINS